MKDTGHKGAISFKSYLWKLKRDSAREVTRQRDVDGVKKGALCSLEEEMEKLRIKMLTTLMRY